MIKSDNDNDGDLDILADSKSQGTRLVISCMNMELLLEMIICLQS